VLAACIALLAFEPRALASLRNYLFDSYQRLMPRERISAPAIVVAIDEASLDARGQWPWPRSVMADLVRKVAQARPAAIGLDVLFIEPDRSSAGADAELAQALRGNPVVLAVAGVGKADRRFPLPPQAAPVRTSAQTELRPKHYPGHLQSLPEIDRAAVGRGLINVDASERIIRRMDLLGRVGAVMLPGFSVELLRVAAGVASLGIAEMGSGEAGLRLGDVAIPLQSDGSFWMHYGKNDPERLVSADNVLTGKASPELLRGKLVLIGIVSYGLQDSYPTPLGDPISGVELHAQVLEQIFDGRFLRRPGAALWLEAALLAAGGLLMVFLVPRARAWLDALLVLGSLSALAFVGLWGFRSGWLIDVATPALGVALVFATLLTAAFAEADRQRRVLREAQARVEGELNAARRIQAGLLPSPRELFAKERRFQLAAILEPARTVGGDFYDCFMVDRNRLFLVVADVSGKGLPASLFMALSKSLIKSVALRTGDDPGAILTRANGEIARDNAESLFVTAFVALLDTRIGSLAFSNAGHEPPWARKPAGVLEQVEHAGGPPLCVMTNFEYPTEYRRLAPGEWLCIVTDGITEAMNQHQAAYGATRLRELLAGLPDGADAEAVVAALRQDVRRFVGASEPSDDLTAMCLRWNGSSEFELERKDEGNELEDLDT
jgi:CHASE2 domain-containing sensor protein